MRPINPLSAAGHALSLVVTALATGNSLVVPHLAALSRFALAETFQSTVRTRRGKAFSGFELRCSMGRRHLVFGEKGIFTL